MEKMTESPLFIAQQLKHNFELLQNELGLTRSDFNHETELIRVRLDHLEALAKDFEERLRTLQDSSVQFKVLASLATSGGLLSLISLLRELFR